MGRAKTTTDSDVRDLGRDAASEPRHQDVQSPTVENRSIQLAREQTSREIALAKEQTRQVVVRYVAGTTLVSLIAAISAAYQVTSEEDAARAEREAARQASEAEREAARQAFAYKTVWQAIENFEDPVKKAPILNFFALGDDADQLTQWAQNELRVAKELWKAIDEKHEQTVRLETQRAATTLEQVAQLRKQAATPGGLSPERLHKLHELERAAKEAEQAAAEAAHQRALAADAAAKAEVVTARRRGQLIQQLGSDQPAARKQAYADLKAGWGNDPELVPDVIAFAQDAAANENGIYNALVLLSHMNRSALKPYREDIARFAAEVEASGGPRTKERVTKLVDRLPD